MFLRLTKLTFVIFTFAFGMLAGSETVYGQSDADEPQIMQSNNNGEETYARITVILTEAIFGKERLFVIARLGNGEKSRQLNLTRLAKAKKTSFGEVKTLFRKCLQKANV